MTPEELLREVVEVPRRAFVRLPEMQVIERLGWLQLITPSLRHGMLNEVAVSVLGEDEVERVIDATVAQYRDLGLRFRWWVGPGSQPDDLAQRLARRGLRKSRLRGMWRATDSDASPPADAIKVEPVDAKTLGEFTRVMAEGWQMKDVGPIERYHRALIDDPERRQRLLIARHDGEPAAAAAQVCFSRSTYLLGAVVLPRFRGRGLYRALVTSRLAEAAARGLPIATSQALEETAAPVLERMGFVTLCDMCVFSGE